MPTKEWYNQNRETIIAKAVCWAKEHPERRKINYTKYHSSPKGVSNRRRSAYLRRYNLTLEDYDNLLVLQNSKCAICKSSVPKRKNSNFFAVDHCHVSGKVRGLLCNSCNIGLSKFEDNTVYLATAIAYLGGTHHVD